MTPPNNSSSYVKDGLHHFDIRVYYEDTDAGGIVYYANYLRFAERARTESLRLCGFDQSALMNEHKIGFVVRRCTMNFFKPAKLDDVLTIQTELHDINKASMVMHQTILRGNDTLVTVDVKLAVVGEGMTLAKLPDMVQNATRTLFDSSNT